MKSLSLTKALEKNLILVGGKGGVGKTTLSHAFASALAKKGKRTLWVTIEDPERSNTEVQKLDNHLYHVNCKAEVAFEEYVGLKLKVKSLAKLFVRNRLMKYLANAGPGIHELVLLGKIWHERGFYDRVVVDMPSTGFGLAMYESVRNFRTLFMGGPIRNDTIAMLETFGDPNQSCNIIVSLAEEMPLQESLELNDYLLKLFPENPSSLVVNRVYPRLNTKAEIESSQNLVPKSCKEFLINRSRLEEENLETWNKKGLDYEEIQMIPVDQDPTQKISEWIAREVAK